MVKVFYTTPKLEAHRKSVRENVGFVPTMGNLHAGHLSLLEHALQDFSTIYFSIFVNPKQFGPHEDFNRYPRTLKEDINLIEGLLQRFPNREVIIYAPKDPQEVYPEDFSHTITVPGLSEILEGKIRPGHFDGVTTVVHRLFELVKPSQAYFGLKDYQQYVIIKKMVEDLQLPIQILGLPIVREETGLALSSRNQYLNPEQKKASLLLSQSLREVAQRLDGKRSELKAAKSLIAEKLQDKNWNYLEIRDALNLSEDIEASPQVTILGVYQLGSTRLLDNLQMEMK